LDKIGVLKDDPYPGKRRDKERLKEEMYRMHISRSFTVFYVINEEAKQLRYWT
jgi:hypothetical protein